jgi:hypothetical protein
MAYKKEIDKEEAKRFCLCCGRRNDHIWLFLTKTKPKELPKSNTKSVKTWKGHSLYEDSNNFYDGGGLEYCSECGEKLDDEDIITSTESRGEFWGAPCSETIITAFKCSHCGYREDM